MINKKFLDFPQITVKETLQLSKKDFKNIEKYLEKQAVC